MTKKTQLSAVLALALVMPLAAGGQDSSEAPEDNQDPGFLERMIQNALGGDGREVRIIGLEGPLSADVTIQAIEVADPEGTWLTIHDVAMSWRRLALLRRRVEIDTLTIGSVEMLRAPQTPPAPPVSIEAEPEDEDAAPSEPFSLPDLPVSIELGSLGVGRIDLGEALLGHAASLSVDGAAKLADGEGNVRLQILRLDDIEGLINLDAGFENETSRLFVTLDVEESEGGLIASLANFPGAPAVDLGISGDAPLSNFVADIQLATDGEERLAGTVALAQNAESSPVVTTIDANLGGDITPLFLPEYRDFFGEDVSLAALVRLNSETGTTVETLELASQSLNLSGQAAIGPTGLPQLVDVSGRIGTEDRLPVTLPVPGAATTVNDAFLRLDYDASEGDAFLARIGVVGLRQDDITVDTVDLSLDGVLSKTDEPLTVTGVTSALAARLSGLRVGDEEINSALSGPITFDADVAFDPDAQTVTVRDLALVSGDLNLDGEVDVTELGGAMDIAARVDLTTGDLSRFAPLAKQPLDGSFDGKVAAAFAPNSGAFDVDLTGLAQDLAIGNPQVDGLLAGRSDLKLTAHRDADGISLDLLDVSNPQLSAKGTGALSSTGADLDLDAQVNEANLLAPQLSGPLSLTADVTGTAPDYRVAVIAGGAAITDQLGDPIDLEADLVYEPQPGHLGVPSLRLSAGELQANGQADVTGLNDALALSADLDLTTGDLGRFATLTGQPLSGNLAAAVVADFAAETGDFHADVSGQAQNLAIGNAQVDQLLAGQSDVKLTAYREDGDITLEMLDISNPQLSAKGNGTLTSAGADLDLDAQLNEANMVVAQLSGPLTVTADVAGTAPDYTVAVQAAGAAITDPLGDPITLDANVVYEPEPGHLGVPSLRLSAGDLQATGQADVTGLNEAAALSAQLAVDTGDLGRLAALTGQPLAGNLTADVVADFATGTGDFHADVSGRGQDITIGNPQVDQLLAGTTDIVAKARSEDGLITIETLTVDNPELQVSGGGTFEKEQGDLTLSAELRELGLFVPQLRGPLTLDSSAKGSGSAWDIDLDAQGPEGLHAKVNGGVAPTDMALAVDIGLGNLGVFVSQLPGAVSVVGDVTGNGTDYFVDVDVTAPAGMVASVDGRAYGPDGTMDLDITGDVPMQIADAFISPRSLSGNANIDIAVNGAPGLDAVSGGVTFDGAVFKDPSTRIVLDPMSLYLALNNGSANLDFRGNLDTGGQIRVSGPIALSDPYDGNIVVDLDDLTLVDPQLYTIDVEGQIALSGALAGGASITGRIDIPRAEISIPNATGGGGAIPEIVHVGEPGSSRQTRERAKILRDDEKPNSGGTAPVAYPLDLVVSAPARVFVRGRGLDAEFGGELTIRGTSADPIPSGRFEIIRGRMDILNRVLVFTEAVITMGGDLIPDLYMVATSEDAPIDANIQIEGPIDDPELTFTSTPELPEDEVLAQLFFGKPVRDLSPLEVAGLLSAISTLTGGGGGVFGSIRDGLGVDQLNVGSNSDGDTEVTAGKYLSEDVYTDVTVDSQGTSRVQLNYEWTDSFTVRGGFANDGDTRLGITFERDY